MGWATVWLRILVALALAPVAGFTREAICQVTLDGTANRQFAGAAPPFKNGNYDLRARLGRTKGGNLFHSFERFSLRAGEQATFSAPENAHIRNIISRVTGGERSDIDGAIVSTIPDADFYFINPAGVVFGPDARLDVQGSFYVSTADELRFADGKILRAGDLDASSFTTARPEAFGFLDRSAGRITVDRTDLPVLPNHGVTLVGGDVLIDHGRIRLNTAGGPGDGNVTLVAMSRPGTVAIVDGATSGAAEGQVRIRGAGATPNALLAEDGIDVSSPSGGGVVRVRAGALVIEDAEIRADNRGATTNPAAIDIRADSVRLDDGAAIRSLAFGAGDAGDVTVNTGDLEVLSGASLRSDTLGAGNAGDVSVLDGRRVLISRQGSGKRTDISSSVKDAASGHAGVVTVDADEITVDDSAAIFSISRDAGAGDAGRVVIKAGQLTLLAGGQVGSGTLDTSSGRGGNVAVSARELVISGHSTQINPRTHRPEPSGIFVSSESEAPDAGRAGAATVSASVIRLADRGEISSESVSNEASGELVVTAAERLVIDAGEISTKAEGAGDGGRITIRTGALSLRNGGLVSSRAQGDGDAGSVDIRADQLVSDRGQLSTNAKMAGGGEIQLRVGDLILLRDSTLATSVAGGNESSGGNILIDPDVLVIDRSVIQADAPEGLGGDITIVADRVIVPERNLDTVLEDQITASGVIAGSIALVVEEVTDLAADLVILDAGVVDIAPLRARCGARRDIGASSFTGVGRGGLPPSPEGPLASGYLGAEVASAAAGPALPAAGPAPTLVLPCAPRF